AGSSDRYFQDTKEQQKLVPEGVEARVPYKGKLDDVVFQLVGGIRAGMGLCGAPNLKALRENAQLVTITPAGVIESHPHTVPISKESPNYWRMYSAFSERVVVVVYRNTGERKQEEQSRFKRQFKVRKVRAPQNQGAR